MTPKQLRCFVDGCNNEHSSRHLLPIRLALKRAVFDKLKRCFFTPPIKKCNQMVKCIQTDLYLYFVNGLSVYLSQYVVQQHCVKATLKHKLTQETSLTKKTKVFVHL